MSADERLAPFGPRIGHFAAGSETSRLAAIAIYPKSGTQRHHVLDLIASVEGGHTCDEVALILGLPPQSSSARFNELAHPHDQDGADAPPLIAEKGQQRRTRWGRMAEVYVVTTAGRDALEAIGPLPRGEGRFA